MRKNLLIAAAVIPALLLTGCMGGKKKQTEETKESKVLVKVDPARMEKVARTVDFTASLEADKDYFIIPSVSGTIEKIYVEVGDKVKKDQLLVDLDKTQYNANRVQLVLAESTVNRMKPVMESGGISQSQYDEAATQLAVLKENDQHLQKNLAFRSPIDGYVTAKYFEDGQLYSMSMNKDQTVGILRVMDMQNLKARVNIPEQYFADVKIGMPVTIKAEHTDKLFNGKVSRIQPAINSATRSFEVEVAVPNHGLELRPGMFARTTFNMAEVESVTVLDLAVQKQAGTNDRYVFVIKDGKAERKLIVPGRQVEGRIEVLSGVNAGEEIVTAGMSRLRTGTQVEITNK